MKIGVCARMAGQTRYQEKRIQISKWLKKDGTLEYLQSDHLGSTSITTDTSGAVTSRTRYKPFGEVLLTSNQETSGTLNTERKFTGQIYDTGTDFYYMGGRYYDRLIRRFTSAEGYLPAFNAPQTLNRYSYAGNNPLSPIADAASFSGVAVARYKPSNHNGLPVSNSNPGGTKAVSQESASSANQGFAWQMAMLNLYSQGPNPNIVYDEVPAPGSFSQNVSAQVNTTSNTRPSFFGTIHIQFQVWGSMEKDGIRVPNGLIAEGMGEVNYYAEPQNRGDYKVTVTLLTWLNWAKGFLGKHVTIGAGDLQYKSSINSPSLPDPAHWEGAAGETMEHGWGIVTSSWIWVINGDPHRANITFVVPDWEDAYIIRIFDRNTGKVPYWDSIYPICINKSKCK